MVLKTLQSLVPELPKLEPGDPATRARRFQQWLLRVGLALQPAGTHVTSWWQWCINSAEEAHKVFVQTPLHQREHVTPTDSLPPQHSTVECWMRPKILQCLPKAQLDWVELRAQAGTVDPCHVLIFYAYKLFSPGSPDEKDALIKRILNPNVCAHPASAQMK